jgi:hypothetical protein
VRIDSIKIREMKMFELSNFSFVNNFTGIGSLLLVMSPPGRKLFATGLQIHEFAVISYLLELDPLTDIKIRKTSVSESDSKKI